MTADLAIGVIHLFRMPVFFLLSGFFARLVYVRLGITGFVWHRTQRIVVPLVIALPLISPAHDALWRWGAAQPISLPIETGYALPRFDMGAVMISSLAHLWFLYYLAVLFAMVIGVVWMLRNRRVETAATWMDYRFGLAIRRGYFSCLMAIPTMSFLSLMELPGLPDNPVSALPQPRLLAHYGLFLVVGWFLHRQCNLVPELGCRLINRLILVAFSLVPYALWAEREVLEHAANAGLKVIGLYFAALLTWELVLLFIGCFVRYLSAPRVWVRWLADASYWSYLVHLPVVIILQILLVRLAWPGIIKYALIVSGALTFCLVTYQCFVRYTFIGAILNGKRTRPSSPQRVTAAASS